MSARRGLSVLNRDAVEAVLLRVKRNQERRDGRPARRRKRAAKQRAATLLVEHAGSGPHKVLDVGGESWYAPYFAPSGFHLEALNYPDDMHTMSVLEGGYDVAIAMHVLEHSPFPLLVLELVRRALRQGGWLYVAVPHPTPKWLGYKAHVTMMPPTSWAWLLSLAGFTVVHQESGRFGASEQSVEERFVCRLAP